MRAHQAGNLRPERGSVRFAVAKANDMSIETMVSSGKPTLEIPALCVLRREVSTTLWV